MGWIVALVAGYMCGTLPTADLAARLSTRTSGGGAVDLRTAGSGNPGATNAAALLGARWGVFVLIGDIAKAVVASLIGWVLAGGSAACWAATAAVAGHCWPVWTRFRGGKGVACSAGQCAAVFPAYFPIDLFVAYATARWKRQAYGATVAASACWVLFATLWWVFDWPNLWGPRHTGAVALSAAASSAIILIKFEVARRLLSSRRPEQLVLSA